MGDSPTWTWPSSDATFALPSREGDPTSDKRSRLGSFTRRVGNGEPVELAPVLVPLLTEGEKGRPCERTGRAEDDETLRWPWLGEDGVPIIDVGRRAGVPSVPIASEWRREGEKDIVPRAVWREDISKECDDRG